jgi:hypothetical protein
MTNTGRIISVGACSVVAGLATIGMSAINGYSSLGSYGVGIMFGGFAVVIGGGIVQIMAENPIRRQLQRGLGQTDIEQTRAPDITLEEEQTASLPTAAAPDPIAHNESEAVPHLGPSSQPAVTNPTPLQSPTTVSQVPH